LTRHIKYFFIAWLFVALNLSAFAQDRSFAKKVIDTLTSPYFSGRGYVCHGDSRAAEYISGQFIKEGVQPYPELFNHTKKETDTAHSNEHYYQDFQMPVNTFPGKVEFTLGKSSLIPGKDFLVSAQSAKIKKGKYTLIEFVELKNLKKSPRGKVALVVNELPISWPANVPVFTPDVFIILKDRLVWTVYSSKEEPQNGMIELKQSVWDSLKSQSASIRVDQKYIPEYHTQNVTGYIKGKTYPDSFIMFTAHYDHLGRMGCNTYFPGANDNASGTAMLLDLANYYARPENQPDYSVMFVAFTGEEAGLVGSKYFTNHPPFPLRQIAILINMDLMANGQDGMMVVNGSIYPHEFELMDSLNQLHHYLKEINKRGKAANSDHYWFSEKGVPSFFVYLLGDYPWYHDIYDTKEKPTMAGYEGAFKLLTTFAKIRMNNK
jgi:hypothetical protein